MSSVTSVYFIYLQGIFVQANLSNALMLRTEIVFFDDTRLRLAPHFAALFFFFFVN